MFLVMNHDEAYFPADLIRLSSIAIVKNDTIDKSSTESISWSVSFSWNQNLSRILFSRPKNLSVCRVVSYYVEINCRILIKTMHKDWK